MPYKNFNVFDNIQLIYGELGDKSHHFTASPKYPIEKKEGFEDGFFLLHRISEYAAQIEVACAKLYTLFMGYGPEMEIIQDGDKFYTASRRIKNFKEGNPNIAKQEHINLKGLASIHILDYFFCQTDQHSGNFGIQMFEEFKKAFRLDMPDGLSLEMLTESKLTLQKLEQLPYFLEKHFDCAIVESLGIECVNSPDYQSEKKAIIQKIAGTPFETIEAIIRETVTATYESHIRAQASLAIAFGISQEEFDASLATMDFKHHNLNTIIELLRQRHDRWRPLAIDCSVMTQDLSLSTYSAQRALKEAWSDDEGDSEEAVLARDQAASAQAGGRRLSIFIVRPEDDASVQPTSAQGKCNI